MRWAIWTALIVAYFLGCYLLFAGNFRTYAEPVVVPYCVSNTLRFRDGGAVYLPCFDVDRYEYT